MNLDLYLEVNQTLRVTSDLMWPFKVMHIETKYEFTYIIVVTVLLLILLLILL